MPIYRDLRLLRAIAVFSILTALATPSLPCEIKGRTIPVGLQRMTVMIDTELGKIEIEVNLLKAPKTACNFLKYVAAGIYDGGNFGRTVRPDNQREVKIPIAVIQGYPNPKKPGDEFGPLSLERTRDTGLRHLNGTISMARGGVDDATSQFFICIGAQPELDFGGRRNPDGQGFAAFGEVVRGIGVVRQIQSSPAEQEDLKPPILIRSSTIVSSDKW